MIKLTVDSITNKILGYENVRNNSIIYNDDILVDDNIYVKDLLDMYYKDGKLFYSNEEDVHTKLHSLNRTVFELKDALSNKHNDVLNVMLNPDTLSEIKSKYDDIESKLSTTLAEIESTIKSHDEEIANYYKAIDKATWDSYSPKYLSSICLLIKNENQYLDEWISYHLSLGFDHLYIYDNGSNPSVASHIKNKDYDMSKLTIIDFSQPHEDTQTECYMDFIDKFKQDVRFTLFIDSDEFLYLKCGNINTFLSDKSEYTDLCIQSLAYNANGQTTYEDKPVMERFTVESPRYLSKYHYKDCLQISNISHMKTHWPVYNPEKHMNMKCDESEIAIKHYYTKSWEEWIEKMNRGSCDPNYRKNVNEFFLHNPDMKHLFDENFDLTQGYYG